MDPKKISLLLDIVESCTKQLEFVAGELCSAKADVIEKECGFHDDVRDLRARHQRKGATA